MNQTMNLTRMSQTQRSNDLDFNKYMYAIENEIEQNWLGFKYVKQLENRRAVILKKIEQYQSQLKNSNGELIIYCDFTFNENLDLFIKALDIRKQFLDQPPPNQNIGVKINQQDLFSALTSIKEFMFNECRKFKEWLLKNYTGKGDIWNQAEWYLQNNNDQESDKYFIQAEKHRKNMINKLINCQVISDQYLEFAFYIEHYYQYFDRYTTSQRSEICTEFLSFLSSLQGRGDQINKYRNIYSNNMIILGEQKFLVNNTKFSSQNQISIPNFLWAEIQKLGVQGYVLYKMIENKEFNLNYKVIERIFLRNQRAVQNNHALFAGGLRNL